MQNRSCITFYHVALKLADTCLHSYNGYTFCHVSLPGQPLLYRPTQMNEFPTAKLTVSKVINLPKRGAF